MEITEYCYGSILVECATVSTYCPVADAAIIKKRQLQQNRKRHEHAMKQLKQAIDKQKNRSDQHG